MFILYSNIDYINNHMKLKKIKVNNEFFNIYFKSGVFLPTATTDFLIKGFLKNKSKLKKKKILDLGCGSGIVSIILASKIKNNIFYASDLSNQAIKCCKKNFLNFRINGEVKRGNMLKPWLDYKFDFIINDVSGISSSIAKKSSWFKNVPASTGSDGTKLTISVIRDSSKLLNKNGSLYLPLISLSNEQKIINTAKKYFKQIKIISKNYWFLPADLEKNYSLLNSMKNKKNISFEFKFGKYICCTKILELKKN